MRLALTLAVLGSVCVAASAQGSQCTAAAPDNVCIPGSSRLLGCNFEWQVTPEPPLSRGVPKNRAVCYEGDPACDFDNDPFNHSCTFHVSLCINNHDARLPMCFPSGLERFEVKLPNPSSTDPVDSNIVAALEQQAGSGPNGFGLTIVRKRQTVVSQGALNATPNLCSPALDIVVPLRVRNGRTYRTLKLLRTQATSASAQVELDTLQLECRPSTCGDGLIESDHENCDDGNRINGDGCDAGCHKEPPTPTPTETPTDTVTETPTTTLTPTAVPSSTPTLSPTSTSIPTPTPTTVPSSTSTPVATATATLSPTPTATNVPTSTPSNTPTPTPSDTPVPTATTVPTNTPTSTATRTPTRTPTLTPTVTLTASFTSPPTLTPTNLPPVHVDRTAFPVQSQSPCLIFVHGKQTNTDTYTDWNAARNYWVNGSDDFVRTATKGFATSYYVVNYNGTLAYWDPEAAGQVATEIVNATNGGPDGGGNVCARTWADGGTFWVVAHSMGPMVMDYILGNSDPSDPNYNLNGPYDVAAQRLSLVISIAGTHRGSQGADYVCGQGNPLCSFFAQFIQNCDTATYWLRSSDDVQVKSFANTPAKTLWLTGGYAAIVGASLCLNGEDDGVVQYASIFACNGSATASYDNTNVCDNNNKQEPSGFMNLDGAHENHDQERDDSTADTRVNVPSGIWICNGSTCAPNTSVQSAMSTAQFVSTLY